MERVRYKRERGRESDTKEKEGKSQIQKRKRERVRYKRERKRESDTK